MAITLILGPILGGLSENGVNLWGRAAGRGRLYAWIGRRSDLRDASLAARSAPLRPQDGYAGVAPVRGLRPATQYYYALTTRNVVPPVQEGYPSFLTLPLPGQKKDFNFVFGSCFRPTGKESGQIFESIITHQGLEPLRFLMLLGDQIYPDDWKYNGLWMFGDGRRRVATSLEDYRNVYQHVWSNDPLRRLLRVLPTYMILDDHEVEDDWHWTTTQRLAANLSLITRLMRFLAGLPRAERQLLRPRVQSALQAYWEHQGMHAPLMPLPPRLDANGQYELERHAPGSLAYSFTVGAAAFFVLDTRTMRVRRWNGEHHMLGTSQWHILKEWLLDVKDKYPVKFLVSSSSILFNMWVDLLGDRWTGFPAERAELLRFIGENGIEGLHILTGDLHSGHAVRAEVGPRGRRVPIWEFCASPFEQKCSRCSRLFYSPIPGNTIGRQKVFFTVGEPNYGVIRVTFSVPAKPGVEFQLYDTHGQEVSPPAGS
ncbi:MAG: alkaline phosphatase family protein [Anaerolineales bacterium]|nr:alkaline phosphatase family protein [Anaerolineales bacterium]